MDSFTAPSLPSVEDDNYILTVNSAMADANVAFFQISLEGKNEESEKIIQEVLDWVAPRYIDGSRRLPPKLLKTAFHV